MGKRKALSSAPYNQFLQQSWEKIGKKGDYNEFVKTCDVKWREMTDSEKEEFNLKENEKNLENGAAKRPRKCKKEKDPSKPKRPKSSYLLFCDSFRDAVRKSNPEFTMPQVSKELSSRWNGLESSEKQKYIDMADVERKKYQELKNGDDKKGTKK